MLHIVDGPCAERRVVKQHFDAVRSGVRQSSRGPFIQQPWQSTGYSFVIASLFIRQQETRVLRPLPRRRESILRIEQNCARMGSQNSAYSLLEFLQHPRRNFLRRAALGFGEKRPQSAALIDR